MGSVLKTFFDALTTEQNAVVPAIASDNLGVLLKSAVCELDWYYYNIAREQEPTSEQQEQMYLIGLGVTRLIRLALGTRATYDVPVVTFRRTREISMRTLQIVSLLGIIDHGRRVAQSVQSGLAKIEQLGPREFLFTLPTVLQDVDFFERAVASHYREQYRRQISAVVHAVLAEATRKADQLLTELVYPFATHYIGYGADPHLDEYFFGLAYAEIQGCEGFDTFHYSARFGGVPYQKYILAVTYVTMLHRRHERFAEALVKKEPSISLANILTITSDTPGFVEGIRDVLNWFGVGFEGFEETTLEEAARLFDVISISRKNAALLDRPGAPWPLLIQNTEAGLIRSIAAAHSNPVLFLLESLRQAFPSDYNRHQQSREAVSRRAMKRVLNDCFTGLDFRDRLTLRVGGKELTDVDLVVLEPATGSVLLCQLKYQELYGADWNARHVRGVRLKDQVGRWLAAVDLWQTTVGSDGIRSALRLSKEFPQLKIFRVVVAHHYAYPLKEFSVLEDIACGTWPQVINALTVTKQKPNDDRQLVQFFDALKSTAAPGPPQTHLDEPDTEWILPGLKFTIRQDADGAF